MKKIITVIAAAAAMLIAAPAAQADDYGQITITPDATVCGQVTLTVSNTTAHPYSGDWRVPGDTGEPDEYSDIVAAEGPLAGQPLGNRYVTFPIQPGDSTTVIQLDEDQPVDHIEYRVARGPEQHVFLDWQLVDVETDCEAAVVDEPADDATDGTDDTAGDTTDDSGPAVDTGTDTAPPADHTDVTQAADEQMLAETGVTDAMPWLIGGGIALVAGGVGAVAWTRRRADR